MYLQIRHAIYCIAHILNEAALIIFKNNALSIESRYAPVGCDEGHPNGPVYWKTLT
jgi:hypothetical protein